MSGEGQAGHCQLLSRQWSQLCTVAIPLDPEHYDPSPQSGAMGDTCTTFCVESQAAHIAPRAGVSKFFSTFFTKVHMR